LAKFIYQKNDNDMNIHFKKLTVALAFIIFIVAGIAATNPPDEHAKNLKVLPKNISHEDLDKIMDGFKAALGVKCNFCHAPFKDTTNHHLDFASDDKPEKNIARHMMRMTTKINKKFFSFNKDEKGETIPAVSCITCHRGDPHPEEK
jgi:Photosynthetic reaction centre cytochrome C subunit